MSLRQPLREPRGDLIDGKFVLPSSPDNFIIAVSPADLSDAIGNYPYRSAHVARAVDAGRRAFINWRRQQPEVRAAHLRAYAKAVATRKEPFAVAIARAIGKPLWEARTEVDAVIAKVEITLGSGLDLIQPRALPEAGGVIRYRPIGVCAVIGPFNFPAHLPNGHWVPALATGNVVIFKPSEKAPEVGELIAECALEAGFPPGVFQVIQGGSEVAQTLVSHEGIDAVMFTGSTEVGRTILAQSARWPGRMIALELGGKNAAIVLSDADLAYAAREIAFSAYVTAGQRCTATSRVLVERSVADALAAKLEVAARETRVGPPDAAEVFLGPLIDDRTRQRAFAAAERSAGSYEAVVPVRTPEIGGVHGYYLAPALYRLRDGAVPGDLDREELFAPLLTLEVVDSEERAVERCNSTRYGLASSVYTASRVRFERLAPEIATGICNWNRGTVSSSSRLPFGGVKESGNHRPAGLFSTYYCVDPVAEVSVEQPQLGPLPPGLRVG